MFLDSVSVWVCELFGVCGCFCGECGVCWGVLCVGVCVCVCTALDRSSGIPWRSITEGAGLHLYAQDVAPDRPFLTTPY